LVDAAIYGRTMADGTAGRNGASGNPRTADPSLAPERTKRWPASAVCCVVVLAVLVLALVSMNLFGIHLGRDGGYDADMGGSVADWIGAIGTLVALPAAVLLGVRQLQSSGEAIQLGRHQLAADRAERAERRSAELAALRNALQVEVDVGNVVDTTDLAGEDERTAGERWRHEYRQRGWSPTQAAADGEAASSWALGSVVRSTAELLAGEASPLVPEPWFVALTCRNTGSGPLTLQRLTVLLDGTAAAVEPREELGSGATWRRRLGPDLGLRPAFANRATAEDAIADLTVIVDGCDTADRSVRIIHPLPE